MCTVLSYARLIICLVTTIAVGFSSQLTAEETPISHRPGKISAGAPTPSTGLHNTSPASLIPLISLGDTVPPFPTTGWVEKSPVSLADLHGRFGVLYFCIPGCGSCESFTFHLKRLQLRNPDLFVPIGVADRSITDIFGFARSGTNDIYHFLQDAGGVITRQYMGFIETLPSYAIVDGDGRLIWVDYGDFRSPIMTEIDRLLAKQAGHEARAVPTPGKRFALCIGVGSDPLNHKALPGTREDTEVVANHFRRIGYDTLLLTDTPESLKQHSLDGKHILDLVRGFAATATHDDAIVLFVSASGLMDGEGDTTTLELFLQGTSSDENLNLRDLAGVLSAAPCANLLLADIGHAASGVAPFKKIPEALGKLFPNLTAVFSCSGFKGLSRPSPEYLHSPRSRFVYALLDGLTGGADVNHDGAIPSAELFRHIWLTVQNMNRLSREHQHPFALNLERLPAVAFPVESHK